MNELRNVLAFFNDMGASFLHLPANDPRAELAELNREILQCRRCRLHESKTNYVPGEGSHRPGILFVGEGPGETEDQFGRPFIGRAGQLLDRIIQKMGLRREDVFIGNVVKCRPPNNREPLKAEVEACLPYLLRQIAVLRPRAIVCLGRVALNNLLGTSHSMGRIRGQVLDFQGIPLVATYHPSFILHKRDKEEISKAKWEVWQDMQKVLALVAGDRP